MRGIPSRAIWLETMFRDASLILKSDRPADSLQRFTFAFRTAAGISPNGASQS